MATIKIIRIIKDSNGNESAPVTISTKSSKADAKQYLNKLAQIANSKPRFVRVHCFSFSLRAIMGDGTQYTFKIK